MVCVMLSIHLRKFVCVLVKCECMCGYERSVREYV